jgi:N-acetylmuramoyl-L-alanine amidase
MGFTSSSYACCLIETGFISNPEEENYLNSAEGQKEIADVVVKSIRRYKASLENPASGNTNSGKK